MKKFIKLEIQTEKIYLKFNTTDRRLVKELSAKFIGAPPERTRAVYYPTLREVLKSEKRRGE